MTRKEMTALYNKAKQAELGAEIVCPACGQKHIKITYNKVFCSNARTRGRRNCKDMFWNRIDPQKRCNTTRISPASQAYMDKQKIFDIPVVLGFGDSQKEIDRQDREEMELNFNGDWDSHDNVSIERCEWCNCLICRCEN